MNLVEQLWNLVRGERKRVVVIGDAMVDRWVHGNTHTGCQEGCTKFEQTEVVTTPGGAANAEACFKHWPINTILCAVSEQDRCVKTRFMDTFGRIVYRWDDDKAPPPQEWVLDLAVDWVRCAGGVLLSDYDKGFLTPEFIQRVLEVCQERKIPCVADCKREPEVYKGCILKCNEQYQHAHNRSLSHTIEDGCSVVITAGPDTPLVWNNGKLEPPRNRTPSSSTVSCVNHVGAGDCFAAHLTLALAYGFSLKEAAVIAHSAGRVYVQHPHNRPPYPGEVAADMARVDERTPGSRVAAEGS